MHIRYVHAATAALSVAAALAIVNCSGSSGSAASSATSAVNPTAPTTVATGSTSATSTTPTTATPTSMPAMYAAFTGATVSLEGTTVVIRTTSQPDHNSPYYGVGNAKYEAPQASMVVNPNRIVAQNLTLRVPATPTAATPSDTPLGPMGVATNGVALFNQYAAGRSPLGAEIQTFDRYNGHPAPDGTYHYHLEPLWLTAKSSSALVGVLLDGFPVYGPRDASGQVPTDLDTCNGHTGATAEFPAGVYHYHTTSASPYISGCYHGKPGTVG